MKNKKINLFIDTDPGVDDGLALMVSLLAPQVAVRGISTTYGNHDVDETTNNALGVIDFVHSLMPTSPYNKVPLVKGSTKPLKAPYKPFLGIHGKNMRVGKSWFEKKDLVNRPVEDFIKQTVDKYSDSISIVCLGPLTNLAKFGRKYPNSIKHIKKVVVMGGALFYPGNFNSLVEANFGWDPDAAKIVLNLPFKNIVLVPLNVTEDFQLVADKIKRIKSSSIRAYITKITADYSTYYRKVKKYVIDPSTFKKQYYKAGAIHDVVAMLVALTGSNDFDKEVGNIDIVTNGSYAGQSVLAARGEVGTFQKNRVYYVSRIKKNLFWRRFFKIVNSHE